MERFRGLIDGKLEASKLGLFHQLIELEEIRSPSRYVKEELFTHIHFNR